MSSNPAATHQLEAMHLDGGESDGGNGVYSLDGDAPPPAPEPADVPSDSIFLGLTNHT
jgi:hypothetical protein